MEGLLRGLSKLTTRDSSDGADRPEQLLQEVNFDGIIQFIQENKCKNIITMAGAGISTSAGIPDFRSPESGLYHNLAKFNLPRPEAIFEISFFMHKPEPFFTLAKELYPGRFEPTPCHYFVRLLHEKGLLLRHYTQNIDTLERVAGIPGDKIVEAHGTFFTSHCLKCRKEFSLEWMKERIFADVTPHCDAEGCDGLVKPDIVFFGENLPPVFFLRLKEDFLQCDLLIIMGTSLAVQPFASLVNRVPPTTPRLLINMEKVGTDSDSLLSLMGIVSGLDFDSPTKYRDVFWEGTCDDGCREMARRLGWQKELEVLIETENKKLLNDQAPQSDAPAVAQEAAKATKQSDETAETKAEAEGNETEAVKEATGAIEAAETKAAAGDNDAAVAKADPTAEAMAAECAKETGEVTLQSKV